MCNEGTVDTTKEINKGKIKQLIRANVCTN